MLGIPLARVVLTPAKNTGGGVPFLIETNTIMRESFLMRDTQRTTDND